MQSPTSTQRPRQGKRSKLGLLNSTNSHSLAVQSRLRKRAPNRNKRVKASRRWKKERLKVSKLQRKVTRQREDWLHKTTSKIVSGNSLIAGEQLNVKGMTSKAKKGVRSPEETSGRKTHTAGKRKKTKSRTQPLHLGGWVRHNWEFVNL